MPGPLRYWTYDHYEVLAPRMTAQASWHCLPSDAKKLSRDWWLPGGCYWVIGAIYILHYQRSLDENESYLRDLDSRPDFHPQGRQRKTSVCHGAR
ncbi:MAG: hypothetical protein RJP95_04770 [Pirellulales bacterium]